MTIHRRKIINPKVTRIGDPVVKFIDSTRKVYCKNCKYFSILRSCRHPDYEGPTTYNSDRDKKRSKASGLSIVKRKIEYFPIFGDYDRYNKDNNCPYYKKKWWKFWMK